MPNIQREDGENASSCLQCYDFRQLHNMVTQKKQNSLIIYLIGQN
ncbi:hypothetical protein UUU_07050 [Klebsiella pneumoniae subsp. pneumoniae DSM 30104 = JCM 1662 = NBRC 14940]|nr:hypothetical protein UUU_07050 [Klebsiella pneumoniae subsp. pneumoniae DSM 30104 = JCM 1662 = NBRC 14940]